MVEVELGQPPVCLAQALPRPFRLVHQVVGDERERAALFPAHRAVGDRERAMRRHEEGGLVRADRADLVGDDSAGQLVPEVERLHRLAAVELVQAFANAADARTEASRELAAGAVVVAVGEEDLLGWAVLGEPVEAVLRRDRVDEDALLLEVVRVDRDLDVGVHGAPVPHTRDDLLHSASLQASAGEHLAFSILDRLVA